MSTRTVRLATHVQVIIALALLLAGCGSSSEQATTTAISPPGTPTATARSRSTAVINPTAAPPPTSAPLTDRTIPPGSPLPSEATCAARVHRSSWEPRPDNTAANHRVPTAAQLAGIGLWGSSIGLDPRADGLRKQMTGDFTGTTDEILQWVACKWGFNPNIVRAQAVVESYWHQSQKGDWTTDSSYCPPGTWNGSGCYQSYGILQIKWYYFQGAWPMSRDDTAFNAEYVYGMLRACYEGWTTYLLQGTPLPGYKPYAAGDLWGCLGRWYSGWWYTSGAVSYINKVKAALSQQTWLTAGF
jgi:hypothetical protein